jgi:hypothetical protein
MNIQKDFKEFIVLLNAKCVESYNPPLRIDLINNISGVKFGEAYKNKNTGNYFGIPATFIGKEDLIRNKKAAGRIKDRADLDWINRYSRSKKNTKDIK